MVSNFLQQPQEDGCEKYVDQYGSWGLLKITL